jgi:hypothetical protein
MKIQTPFLTRVIFYFQLLVVTLMIQSHHHNLQASTTFKAVDPGILWVAQKVPKIALNNLRQYQTAVTHAKIILESNLYSKQKKIDALTELSHSAIRLIDHARDDLKFIWISLPLKALDYLNWDHPFSETEEYLNHLELIAKSIPEFVKQGNRAAAQEQLDKFYKIIELYRRKI